jgi:hypothetical protein
MVNGEYHARVPSPAKCSTLPAGMFALDCGRGPFTYPTVRHHCARTPDHSQPVCRWGDPTERDLRDVQPEIHHTQSRLVVPLESSDPRE